MGEWTVEKLAQCPENGRNNIFKTMEKYGDNKWWEFEDKREMAKWQIFEPILMVVFSDFHEGVESLLDYPVWTHEFATDIVRLRTDARKICEAEDKT